MILESQHGMIETLKQEIKEKNSKIEVLERVLKCSFKVHRKNTNTPEVIQGENKEPIHLYYNHFVFDLLTPEHFNCNASPPQDTRIIFSGVTGVGKSTLINTLMNDYVSQASNFEATTKETLSFLLPLKSSTITLVDTMSYRNSRIFIQTMEECEVPNYLEQTGYDAQSVVFLVTSFPRPLQLVEELELIDVWKSRLCSMEDVFIIVNKLDLMDEDYNMRDALRVMYNRVFMLFGCVLHIIEVSKSDISVLQQCIASLPYRKRRQGIHHTEEIV